MEPSIINVHTHVFNKRNVPVKFLPVLLQPVASWLENEKVTKLFSWLSEKVFRQKQWAALINKYHSFVKIGSEKTQADVLKDLIDQYPKGTKFCILTMDMEYMGAGEVPQPFHEQLRELALLKRDPKYRDIILPFIFVHPERPNILEIVKHYIEVEKFAGIKLYPPVGYFPFDNRLNEVFAYAEKNGIPVTTHCSRGGIFYRGRITDAMLVHPITGRRLPKKDNKTFCQYYTDPDNYKYLLARFPNLVLNLAHFGGANEWFKYLSKQTTPADPSWMEKVVSLIKRYPNVYSDLSYTMYSPELYPQLRVLLQDGQLKEKMLFGSDFYMIEREIEEKEFFLCLKDFLGEEDFKALSETNPKLFLKI